MFKSNWMDSISLPRADAPSLAVRLFDTLGLWMERSRQRTALGRLDERLAADICPDRARIKDEMEKPFWRP